MMNKKGDALVYPYDINFTPILRHSRLLANCTITKLISPEGWGLTGKDAACTDGGSDIGISISNSFEEELNNCNTVIFASSERKLDFDGVILQKLMLAGKAKKKVITLGSLNKIEFKTVNDFCIKNEVDIDFYGSAIKERISKSIDYSEDSLHRINTPIIFVLGSGNNTQKFEIQLLLREFLLNNGYKVAQVGSRDYCEFLGFHSFPQKMFSTRINESKKVIFFNRYIREIERTERPDVIIVGIPGGILPFNSDFTNNFGFPAYIVANAIEPDAAIFSTVYEDWSDIYFERLSTLIKHKFGFFIDAFNLSNAQVDWNNSRENMKLSLNILDWKFIEQKKKLLSNSKVPVFNVLNSAKSSDIAEYAVNKLSEEEFEVV